MDYPKDVKEIKNLNAFIRKAKEIESDKYWHDQLSECTLAKDDSWWTRKESPLKWKRHLIQQYLDYKNNKIEESFNVDYDKRQRNIDNRNRDNLEILKSKFNEEKAEEISNILEYITKMRHEIHTFDDLFNIEASNHQEQNNFIENINNKLLLLNLPIIKNLPELYDTIDESWYYETHDYDSYEEAYKDFLQQKEDINNAIETWLQEFDKKYGTNYAPTGTWRDQKYESLLKERAVIDWNNYLTSKEVKKFLSKDDKNESAKEIIYSEEFEPRYKNLHNPLQAKYKNSWTKKELVNDLANFYYQGNLITENYILKGRENDKSFDIAYNDNKDKLEKFKNELQACHPKITMWIDEDNETKSLKESKHKIEEKSRNELLAKTKSQTITRYNKAQEYKGFYIRGVDLDDLLKKDSSLVINCQVGNYRDQIEIENVLYWLQYEIEERNHDLQVTSKYVTQALMDAIDGMNIKVNCDCRRLSIPYGISGHKIPVQVWHTRK